MRQRMKLERQAHHKEGEQLHDTHLIRLAGNLVSAYLSSNYLPAGDLIPFIRTVHATLVELEGGDSAGLRAAVAPKKSVLEDYIICLEDGKKLRTLKRYLKTQFNLTPDEYRKKWRLPLDYPMVAPSYTRLRSAFAKKIGLGRTARRKRTIKA